LNCDETDEFFIAAFGPKIEDDNEPEPPEPFEYVEE
jgi:hypothetical protein